MRVEVHPAGAWAGAVASELAAVLARPGARICLATGSTPAPAYERVPAELDALGADAGGATVILLDEYVGLARDDPARAENQLRVQLIDRLVPAPRVVAIGAEDAQAAAAELDRAAAHGIDLAVVGLGANGHVGMNEPGSDQDAQTRVVQLEESTAQRAIERYGAATRPSGGITLGIGRLLEAGDVWLLATGAEKADILAAVVSGPMGPARPASFLRLHRGLRVLADEPAAAGLKGQVSFATSAEAPMHG